MSKHHEIINDLYVSLRDTLGLSKEGVQSFSLDVNLDDFPRVTETKIVVNSEEVRSYIPKLVNPRILCEYLNGILTDDYDAIVALVGHRVPANQKLCDHPSVQITPDRTVGLLGILNGMFNSNSGEIFMQYNEEGQIIKFCPREDYETN